ncbi:MAG: tRNA (guanosine(37)-N1)-methyltransferase TrmD [Candidatus Enterosoma sp.]|nr:tRNA (guanosine(37)-N1)-methyltransferase TrmD [Bacilli bacterium]MDD7081643.1 tRNA (guanosine(37)-N1)-methyltransferase TrmD [bacterium]MDY3080986.1 tRNA (guanosine(37)-N1)-methyltransferase TrmD [Candidatus Enterosoma sp.]MCI6608346.1 tRNA (guanosine(37)-N1)-methyltransferase TrmD [Bacilli bacterium]MDD7571575.1 tRNA (guanosine(37)-N1)-methyltransferase TrmD [bacterium]
MKIKIMTLFPNFYDAFLNSSIIGRAISKGLVEFELINIRDYSLDKNHRVDDHPIGGGAGLIMRLEPLVDCLRANTNDKTHKILMGPKGHTFTQKDAIRLSKMDEICLICGHYEGVDCRFEDYVDEEMSIGDFVLTGGEIPAMVIADSVVRLLKGAIADDSTKEESFNSSLLEYPQYTYPKEYEGKKIPEILFCGNHQVVEEYHRKEALRETFKHRPDLLESLLYTKKDVQYLNEIKSGESTLSEKEKQAIEKGKRFTK